MTGARVLDLRIAPEGARARLIGGINRPRKRAFGLFKTQDEYVGVVEPARFDIWERQQRAVHARGEIRARRGGTRIEVVIAPPPRTWALIALFFGLYVVIAAGLALREPNAAITLEEIAIAVGGVVVLAVLFYLSGRQQQRHLEAFLDRVFSDVARM